MTFVTLSTTINQLILRVIQNFFFKPFSTNINSLLVKIFLGIKIRKKPHKYLLNTNDSLHTKLHFLSLIIQKSSFKLSIKLFKFKIQSQQYFDPQFLINPQPYLTRTGYPKSQISSSNIKNLVKVILNSTFHGLEAIYTLLGSRILLSPASKPKDRSTSIYANTFYTSPFYLCCHFCT